MPKADTKGGRKRRRRGSIKAEDIVAGAFEVARRSSLDDLSMPILAEHLDVGVTSIYWHFRKKDDLLNAMTDLAAEKLLGNLPEIREDERWQDMLSKHFSKEREIHREDEILCDLLFIRTSTYSRDATHRVLEMVEAVVAKLVAEGFTPENALKVYNTTGVYTRGNIINERILRLSNAPTTDPARQRRMTDWSSMPVLGGLIDRYSLSGSSDEDFEFGLGRLICGFEDLLREQGTTSRKSASARSARSSRSKASTTRKTSTRKSAS